ATLGYPAFGYGIRYEFGIFNQTIQNGYQVEKPENWLAFGNPWEILRRELTYTVKFNGRVISYKDEKRNIKFSWNDTKDVLAVAYDFSFLGYKTNTVNYLIFSIDKSTIKLDFEKFNLGNYVPDVQSKNESLNISIYLYPNDTITEGKFLRLKPQYF